MRTTEITSIDELTSSVREILEESRLIWWFRGHSTASWSLLPKVRRGYSRDQEHYFTNEFRVRARLRYGHCPGARDYPGWLALMQHYGLPTRLLDWTRSPLVAAFFATEFYQPYSAPPSSGGDACIWALAPSLLNESSGFEPLLYPLDAFRFARLLAPAFKGNDTRQLVAAAMCVETDGRMQMQQGAFTIHTLDLPLESLPGADSWLRQLRIPMKALSRIAGDLEVLGFRRGDLFPDLQNLALELTGRHKP